MARTRFIFKHFSAALSLEVFKTLAGAGREWKRLAIIMKTTSDNERRRNVLSSTHFSPSFASLSDE
jgi:hypothetical protein